MTKQRLEQPLLSTRVYPRSKRGLFYRLLVFRTRRAARAFVRASAMPATGRWVGLCQTYRVLLVPPKRSGRRPRRTRESGRIILIKGYLGTRVVTHECLHATIDTAARMGWLTALARECAAEDRRGIPIEERFCHLHSDITGAVVTALYDHGLIT